MKKSSETKRITHPPLVDFLLDAVLPWNGDEWNLKVLDASCGSGIFLVKAFQRLIHRWRQKNNGKDPLVSDLRPLLANNLIGVDKNEEAVRVVCLSPVGSKGTTRVEIGPFWWFKIPHLGFYVNGLTSFS